MQAALANFGRLSQSIRGQFTAAGVRIETIAPGSLFGEAGLRAGDLVTAVDGKPLRSLDDAADLYARASTAQRLTVQIVRAGKPLTLHVAIQ